MIFIMAREGRLQTAIGILFWLAVWQLAAMAVNEGILLASPLTTLRTLVRLVPTGAFWQRVAFSAGRIVLGFFAALAAGSLLAALSAASKTAATLTRPLMQLIKAVPVASFIILALLWVRSAWLAALISFFMVLPVVYTAVLQGVLAANAQLLEMAAVFRLPFKRTLRAVWLPQVWPYFRQSCTVAMGLAWKSGIAAEVIGLPGGSIGEALYRAKLYLETGELFAWTAVIVLVSAVCEAAFLRLLHRAEARLKGGLA